MKQDTNAVKMVKTFNKFIEAYHKAMQPICEETDLPPMAMDILMFLSNNPEYNTAKDICKYRGSKIRSMILNSNIVVRWIVVITGILGILVFGIWGSGYSATNFIYFQF